MMNLRSALLGGAFLVAAASSAFAQSIESGPYLRGDVGGAFGVDTTFKSTQPSAPGTGTGNIPVSIGNSVLFGGGVGYKINPMFRTDFTLDYIPSLHAKGTQRGGTAPGTTASADMDSLVGMVNGYVDLDGFMPGMLGPFQPYIDGGLGFARNNIDTTSGTTGGVSYRENGAVRTSFAWGAGAGVGYALSPNLTLDLAYKYVDMGEYRTGTSVSTGGATIGVAANKATDVSAHTVTLGIRWQFGVPEATPVAAPVPAPPAPPPAAVAPQQQMFIVFFEFDKSTLTPDGAKVVAAAASAFKSGKSNVAIAGYTDLSGTQSYNLALSKRRADIVKSTLAKDGVPASAINESWHGKENPRVPTADGVREPQNRRVEITM